MKIINFINPVDPHTIRSGKIWLNCTLILVCITVIFITYMQISQLQIWLSCRCAYKKYSAATMHYAQIMGEKKKLSEQEQKLKKYLDTIINLHDDCNKYIEQLKLLHTLCTQGAALISCSLASGSTNITLHCDTIDQAQIYCTSLNKNKCAQGLHIASIVPKKNSFTITLKATQGAR